MSNTAQRLARTAALVVLVVSLASWLNTPFGSTPGTPLRMVAAEGTDLGVAALTVSNGPDHRWFHIGDAALTQIPPRWLYLLRGNSAATGQRFARERGAKVAAELVGVPRLDRPESVSPGEVSGTSSGLAWALATLLLNDPELRSTETVYATGSLYGNGDIGEIGGLDAKLRTPGLADAAAVLVPQSQYQRSVTELRRNGRNDVADRVVGVTHILDALEVLCQREPQAPTCRIHRKLQAERAQLEPIAPTRN